ncbi:MAG: M42 family metallopeptidase [Clostridia bacterium]|nr:M42 family metallopeptidase [Clostridia bacterium]
MKYETSEFEKYYFETAKELFAAPSPSGYTREIMPVLEKFAAENGCGFELTKKGCALLTVKGSGEGVIGACAHVDTLGAMVRSVSGDGKVKFTRVGGPQLPTLDGEYCTIIARDGRKYSGTILSESPSSHVYKDAESRERNESGMYVRLDVDFDGKDGAAALGIENGCYICIDPKTTVTESGYLKSRFIDDKGGVACILTAIHLMHEKGLVPEKTLKILITVYEEVGHGAAWVPEGLESMLGVDMGCIGEDLSCTEHDVSICAKDSTGPYDYELTNKLIEICKKKKLPYAVDVYPYYGSDVGAMRDAGYDVPGALIGPGVHASHGMERTHIDGVAATVNLVLGYFGF